MTKRVNRPSRKVYASTANVEAAIVELVRSAPVGTQIRLREFAEALGYSNANPGQVSRVVAGMIRDGKLSRKGKTYRVLKRSTAKKAATAKATDNEAAYAGFVSQVNTTLFEYIKVTRNTDALSFLTWLESKV